MPPINHVAVTAGLAAVSVAVAAAIALYESEDVRRYSEQVRRRIALALHSLGNELDPSQTRDLEPLFNRPEDAEGFLMSSRGGEGGVDADAETRKRQREELMYWNAIRESKLEAERAPGGEQTRNRGASFDDFMQRDESADNGAFVINTGADTNANRAGLTRRNVGVGATAGAAGFAAGLHTNPFSDDQQIDDDDEPTQASTPMQTLAPEPDEMSDIYSASTPVHDEAVTPPGTPPAQNDTLIDLQSDDSASTVSRTMDGESAESDEGVLNSRVLAASRGGDRDNLFAIIGAWADAADSGEHGQMASPTSTATSFSHLGGQMTPDEEFSLADGETGREHESGEGDVQPHAGNDAVSEADVQSMSEGMFTPTSWSEVGSTVSESEPSMRGRA